jgi:hypothetical protein
MAHTYGRREPTYEEIRKAESDATIEKLEKSESAAIAQGDRVAAYGYHGLIEQEREKARTGWKNDPSDTTLEARRRVAADLQVKAVANGLTGEGKYYAAQANDVMAGKCDSLDAVKQAKNDVIREQRLARRAATRAGRTWARS